MGVVSSTLNFTPPCAWVSCVRLCIAVEISGESTAMGSRRIPSRATNGNPGWRAFQDVLTGSAVASKR